MRINLRCFATTMTEEGLNIPQVSTILQQMGSKAVPQGMRLYWFPDFR
jgi:hypothetical protein